MDWPPCVDTGRVGQAVKKGKRAISDVMLDETHDEAAVSWVESANRQDADFPIQNLPFAVFRRAGSDELFRGGVAVGGFVLDLAAVRAAGGLGDAAAPALAAAAADRLNGLMALGAVHWSALRHGLFSALKAGSAHRGRLEGALVPQADVEYDLPAAIGDYTDFYSSIHHATRVGEMLRPDNPLMANYKWLPVAYHGRSSSVVVSGTPVRRPVGQWRGVHAEVPSVGPSLRLDYELELGFFVGPGNRMGHPVPVASAEQHVFGACVLNDWSARDIQGWEYQPLGPFLGKNFATSISPWVVTMAALAPFRVPFTRGVDDPAPLPHLDLGAAAVNAAFDIQLDVCLASGRMRDDHLAGYRLAHSNFRHAYWALAQMVAHHSSNGCNLRPGDLLGTGTISGPGPGELGSMLEVTHGGRDPVTLTTGEPRRFVEDGDSIIMRAWCERPGAKRIGFGTCTGTVLPALV